MTRAAFTILELLLVLVILGLLAGVVAVKFAGQSESARIKTVETQLKNFRTALDMFDSTTRRYPTTSEGLQALIEKPADAKQWKKTLDIDALPLDPWDNPYQYRIPGQHRTDGYDLWSYGPDGKDGTEDDIGNWTK